MREFNLKLKPSKFKFGMSSFSYLLHTVSANGNLPDMDRVKAIEHMPLPKNKKALKSYLGFVSFYRKFIYAFSQIAHVLNKLLKDGALWKWGPEEQY